MLHEVYVFLGPTKTFKVSYATSARKSTRTGDESIKHINVATK
jgi:hypothetical protein